MDHISEWIELLLISIGLFYSLRALPAKLSAHKIPGIQGMNAGSSSFVPLNAPSTIGIQRWITRTVRRKESPDDDTDCRSSH